MKLKDNIIWLVIIFAFFLRLNYLNTNTALWFDEAEYLSIAKHWAFGIPYSISYLRPILFPLVASLLYRLGATELTFRVIELLISVAGVYLTYLVGRELYKNSVGLIAAFLMSVFYIHLFLTARILVEVIALTLWLLAVYIFLRGYAKKKSKLYVVLLGPVIVAGVLTRFPTGLVAVAILLYLLVTEGLSFLRNRQLWASLAISILIILPYFVWYYAKYSKIAIIGISYGRNFNIPAYLKLFPSYFYSPFAQGYFGNVLLLLFFLSFIFLAANITLGFDLVRKEKRLGYDLFTLLLILVPFLYFGLTAHVELRYLLFMFPGAFIVIGKGLMKIHDTLSRYNKQIAVVLVIFLLAYSGYHQIRFADQTIKSKAESYIQLRLAGEWIKQNSEKEDIIISAGAPQITYYSDREVAWFGDGEESRFKDYVYELKPKYLVLSLLEKSPDWTYEWPEKNPDMVKPVMMFSDKEKKIPIVVVYEFTQ